MKAIGNNIIITPEKISNNKTKGGLLIIEKDREDIRYNKAVIIEVSDDIKVVKKGDKIFYDKHAGHAINWQDDEYQVITVKDVVLVE